VSCYLRTRRGGPPDYLSIPQLFIIGRDGNIISASTLMPTVLFRHTETPHDPKNATVWTFNHAVQVFADDGQRFQGFFLRDKLSDTLVMWDIIGCHISGHLVKLQ